jgi:5'-nucleotidase
MGYRTGRLLALTTGITATVCVAVAGALLPANATAGSQARPATDAQGQGSTPQEAPSYAKPEAPDQVAAELVPGGVRVSWDAVAAQPAVTRYVVHAGPGSCPVTVRAGATSAVLPVVAGQTVITPKVEAVNPYGFSAGSTAPTVDVTGRASSRYVNLQILQLSDFHGAIQASPAAAGAAVLASAWKRDRARVPATVIVSSGDNIGGSPPVSALFEEFPTIKALDLMGLDVSTFGNHEHDRPLEHLRRVIDASDFRWVVSNYSTLDPLQGERAGARDLLMLRRGGVTIGIVGMNTEDTPDVVAPGNLVDPRTGVKIEISASTRPVQRAVDRARERGADVVIALAHQGWAQNVDGKPEGRLLQVARNLRGADVVYGGHTHQAYLSYVRQALVAQVPNSGYEYSRTQVCVDTKTSRVIGADTDTVTVADLVGVPPDQTVQSLVDGYVAQMQEQLDVRIGVVNDVFPRGGTPPVERSGETPMGTFAAETLLRVYGTQLAFVNGGGIRDTLPAGRYVPGDTTLRRPTPGSSGPYDVTLGDLYAVFPFGNNAATTRISGRALWAALENGVSGYPSDGRFPQIAGFRFTFDPSQPVGDRIVSVTLADGTPLPADATTYSVTTLDFMVYGGDGFGDLFQPTSAVVRGPYVEDVIATFQADLAAGDVTAVPAPDGRITVVR